MCLSRRLNFGICKDGSSFGVRAAPQTIPVIIFAILGIGGTPLVRQGDLPTILNVLCLLGRPTNQGLVFRRIGCLRHQARRGSPHYRRTSDGRRKPSVVDVKSSSRPAAEPWTNSDRVQRMKEAVVCP